MPEKAMLADLAAFLEGGGITRYHTKQVLRPQRIDSHSWRMAAVLRVLWPDCRADLLWAVCMHDVSERVTGDLPGPVKWNNAALAIELNRVTTEEEHRLGIRFQLEPEESETLKWLDYYEGCLYCLDELEMGNRKLANTFRRYHAAASDPKKFGHVYHARAQRMKALLDDAWARFQPFNQEIDK